MLSDTERSDPSQNCFAEFQQKNLRKCLCGRRIRDSDDLLRRAGSSKLFVKYVKNHEKMNTAVDERRKASAVSDVISITQQGRTERNA